MRAISLEPMPIVQTNVRFAEQETEGEFFSVPVACRHFVAHCLPQGRVPTSLCQVERTTTSSNTSVGVLLIFYPSIH